MNGFLCDYIFLAQINIWCRVCDRSSNARVNLDVVITVPKVYLTIKDKSASEYLSIFSMLITTIVALFVLEESMTTVQLKEVSPNPDFPTPRYVAEGSGMDFFYIIYG